ncbi:GDP-mannose 4,6-dehydratase, partial [Bacteroidota bacterium]
HNLNRQDYHFIEEDIRDIEALRNKLGGAYDLIIHLAAKAGVRPSIKDPVSYQQVNIQGTQNLLELAKEWGTKQFIFGSSSSVYGINPNVPWSEDDYVLKPISPYAATKVSAELLGHVYSNLYGISFIALRFFTVYGPRQRPDLAIHKFFKLIQNNQPIPMYGDGSSKRDYTYIDDIVSGIVNSMEYRDSDYEIINIGNNHTISLKELINSIEQVIGKKALIDQKPMQPGDVHQTFANIDKAKKLLKYNPNTKLDDGLKEFANWLSMSGL